MNKILECKDLCLEIKGKRVFKGVNFSVKANSLTLIKGKSGSGKSTLLETISRIIPLSKNGTVKGDIFLKGENIENFTINELAGVIGYLMQDPDSQLCTFTVEDEIVFGLENLRHTKEYIQKRLNEVVEFCGIEHLRNLQINQLSGGQKQIVALASIIALDPDLYLLDEPTSQLDKKSSEKVIEILCKLVSLKNKSVIIIEHNLHLLLGRVDTIYDFEENVCIESKTDYYIQRYIDEYRLPENPYKKTNEFLLEVKDIDFSYGKKKIINKLSFHLYKGEILGIMGENGAGKSTLASIISGLRKPNHGIIKIENKDFLKLEKNKIGNYVGLAFQNPEEQFVKFTVEDELALGLKVRNFEKEEIKYKVNRYLDTFGLKSKKDLNPFNISQGEKRKLSVASMLITGQKLLVLDEPSYGQDRENLIKLLELLYKVGESGVGVILISHDFDVLYKSCHRILKMENGFLEEVYDKWY